MIVHGDARKRGHRFGLRAAGEHHQFLWIEGANVLRAHHAAVGHAQFTEAVRDFDIVHHAAAHKTDLASDHASDVNNLLHTVHGAGAAGEKNLGWRGAE